LLILHGGKESNRDAWTNLEKALISKAKRLLGWTPKVDLAEGLKITMEHFQQQFAANTLVSVP
jgi:nucleoside-diphosphate-sugar epimerase